MNATDVEIKAELVDVEDVDERATDFAVTPYDLRLSVGDWEEEVRGWVLVGWLWPGASSDLDGRGLAQWGDSQPGGWSYCWGDGASSGIPSVSADGDRDQPITVDGDAESVSIPPTACAAWQAALDRDDPDEASRIREAVAAQLREAIDEAAHEVDVPEPDSETIYLGLDELDELEDLPIRAGNWRGAGHVLAWRCGEDDYDHRYWPDDGDIADAVEKADILSVVREAVRKTMPTDD